MEQRTLGRTGRQLSVIGFGGIVVCDVTPTEADAYVAEAIDRGVNYFDVAPIYGNAQERLGPALAPYRDQAFLACKTVHRGGKEATADLHRSLELLKTDHFDLYQFHNISSLEQAEKVLAPGGALEAFIEAREQGLIRHIGFSAHSEAAAVRLLDEYPFDSVLMPVNIYSWRDGGFGQLACAKAVEKGAGVLAIKGLAKRPLRDGEEKKWTKCWYVPIEDAAEARAALAFTLSQPVTAAVSPGYAELLWLACDAVEALESGAAELAQEPSPDAAPLFTAEESDA
jgi:aryl-alcohol dehydrogenase-like predicted oxidoreductase